MVFLRRVRSPIRSGGQTEVWLSLLRTTLCTYSTLKACILRTVRVERSRYQFGNEKENDHWTFQLVPSLMPPQIETTTTIPKTAGGSKRDTKLRKSTLSLLSFLLAFVIRFLQTWVKIRRKLPLLPHQRHRRYSTLILPAMLSDHH